MQKASSATPTEHSGALAKRINVITQARPTILSEILQMNLLNA